MKLSKKTIPLLCAAIAVASLANALRAEGIVPASGKAKRQLIEWVRNNNKDGPDDAIVKQIDDQLTADIDHVNLVELTLGGGMTRSGKTSRIAAFAGEFFAFEFTDSQGEASGTKPTRVDYATGSKNRDRRETPPLAQLSELTFHDDAALDGSKKLSGSITVKVTGALPPAKLALRMTVLAEQSTKTMYFYPDVKAGVNKLSFTFDPINDQGSKPVNGPFVAYVDFGAFKSEGGKIDAHLLSNTTATLINVR